jgi:hypothetical protein
LIFRGRRPHVTFAPLLRQNADLTNSKDLKSHCRVDVIPSAPLIVLRRALDTLLQIPNQLFFQRSKWDFQHVLFLRRSRAEKLKCQKDFLHVLFLRRAPMLKISF